MEWELQTFGNDRYTWLRCGTGDPKYVIFPPTRELVSGLRFTPKKTANFYRRMFPRHFSGTIYIMGYNPQIKAQTWCRDIAKDFEEVLTPEFGPFNLIGISYGGAIAIPFAEQNPELVQKLVLLVSAYGLSEEGVTLCKDLIHVVQTQGHRALQKRIDNLILSPLARWTIKFFNWIEWDLQKKKCNPVETFVNAYLHISKHPTGLKPHLSGIHAPTLIIGGTKDQFFSTTRYQETEALIPNAKLILFHNRGHSVPIERPRAVINSVMTFLLEK